MMRLWHWMNRRSDVRILWPACKEHANSLAHARGAFYLHASNDPAWTDHYTDAELIEFIDNLK